MLFCEEALQERMLEVMEVVRVIFHTVAITYEYIAQYCSIHISLFF